MSSRPSLLACFSDRVFTNFARASFRPKSSYFCLLNSWDFRCAPPYLASGKFKYMRCLLWRDCLPGLCLLGKVMNNPIPIERPIAKSLQTCLDNQAGGIQQILPRGSRSSSAQPLPFSSSSGGCHGNIQTCSRLCCYHCLLRPWKMYQVWGCKAGGKPQLILPS